MNPISFRRGHLGVFAATAIFLCFSLNAASLTRLEVVNCPIRPAGLSPAWHPTSPAHTRMPKRTEKYQPCLSARYVSALIGGMAGRQERIKIFSAPSAEAALGLRWTQGDRKRARFTGFGFRVTLCGLWIDQPEKHSRIRLVQRNGQSIDIRRIGPGEPVGV